MAIARTIRAADGESLCSIAVDNGFKNCTKLRAENPDFAAKQVEPGDTVKVPEVTQKDETGATDLRHRFQRLGKTDKIWIVQEKNQGTRLDHIQSELAVSNYVTGRQGTGFAPQVWKDSTFPAADADPHDANATADPDHFKVQVFDKHAMNTNLTEVPVTLQVQKPVLHPTRNEIQRWENMTEPGTKLDNNVLCRRIKADSPWYRSWYMRLIVDANEQAGRVADGVDTNDDRTLQTLVTPVVKDSSGKPDKRIEILDLRVLAERPARDCEVANADAKCRAKAVAGVGKTEKVLRMKVFRITGAGADANPITNDQVNTMLFENYRLTLAQANVGVQLVDDKVFDVPPPRNMITVCDILNGPETRATGGKTIGATVKLAAGNKTVTIVTEATASPLKTATSLATALRAQGVNCKVSSNPPDRTSGNNFGSVDILCFEADGTTLAKIVSVRNDPGEAQQLGHTGGWNNGVVHHGDEYGANEPRYRFVLGPDFRAASKNYNTETGHLSVILVNLFAPNPGGGTLLGLALIPYRAVTANLRPIAPMTMAVFLDSNGAARRTVLPHEAGHVLLDLIHTTNSTNPEADWSGNPFPNNSRLAFSEWMAAFSRESNPPVLHLRMSDAPLTNEYQEVFNNLQARTVTLGAGARPSSVGTFVSVSASVLRGLRPLRPAPVAPAPL